jgi:hypothetical protein
VRISSLVSFCSSSSAQRASISLRAEVCSVAVLHVLHRQRRAALDDLACLVVLDDRAGERLRVDAVVLEEAAVLDRDDRLPHHLRDLFGRDDLPVLREELGDQGAVAGDEGRALFGRAVLHVARLLLERLHAVAGGETEASGDGQEDSGDEDAGHDDRSDELHDA